MKLSQWIAWEWKILMGSITGDEDVERLLDNDERRDNFLEYQEELRRANELYETTTEGR